MKTTSRKSDRGELYRAVMSGLKRDGKVADRIEATGRDAGWWRGQQARAWKVIVRRYAID